MASQIGGFLHSGARHDGWHDGRYCKVEAGQRLHSETSKIAAFATRWKGVREDSVVVPRYLFR